MSDKHAHFVDGVFTISDDGGNSEILPLSEGDLAITGLVPDGRTADAGETRGSWTGTRKGARAYPALNVTAKLASPADAFHQLALGQIAGYVSTSAALDDYDHVDGSFVFSIGGETRSYSADDLELTTFDVKEGSPYSTVAMSWLIRGPVSTTGPEGTFTLISSR